MVQWTYEEDEILRTLVRQLGAKNWREISRSIPRRSATSCRLRWLNHLSQEIEKRAFTAEEDGIIVKAQAELGNHWIAIAGRLHQGRSNLVVRSRWVNTLKRKVAAMAAVEENGSPPEIYRRKFTAEEDDIIVKAQAELGNNWVVIAERLKGRTNVFVKNRWSQRLNRRLAGVAAMVAEEEKNGSSPEPMIPPPESTGYDVAYSNTTQNEGESKNASKEELKLSQPWTESSNTDPTR